MRLKSKRVQESKVISKKVNNLQANTGSEKHVAPASLHNVEH